MTANLVDIVIPVYRNHELTQRCVESVLNAPDPVMGAIYLINDATPEPELAQYCQQVAQDERVELIEHTENQGFVASVNEGFRLADGRNVVILNSDTEVPKNWLSRMRAAADQHPKAASITPFSNNATICSYPNLCGDNELPRGLNHEAVDALFSEVNNRQVVEIPTGVGFCMYLRRAAIDDVGVFDADAFGRGYGEENDWCLRATEKGWKHLLCADLFVYHAGGASFGDEAEGYQANALAVISERYPDYERQIAAFIEADPIESARYAVDTARPDSAAVISEYRQREQAMRASRYELDRQRHAQVTALDDVLGDTREAADSERQRYEALLASERAQSADRDAQYQAKLEEMAAGYKSLEASHKSLEASYKSLEASCASLETEMHELNRFWSVRFWRWLQRRLGG